MKPILAVLLLLAMPVARAQQPTQKPRTPPLPPIEPAQVAPGAPGAPGAPAAPGAPGDIEKSVNDIVRRSIRLGEAVTAEALRAAPAALQVELQDLHSNMYAPAGTSRGNRSLIVQSGEPDSAANATAELHLNIMARILRKAVGSSRDEGNRPVMGIDVDGSVFGSASGARNIYLDGYGALFLLSVRYPLLGPDDKPEEVKTKETSSDEWNDATDEELQSSGRSGYGREAEIRWSNSNSSRTSTEDYDADKVEKLKTSLLEALKNATHIRILKPDDFVTVVVQGAEAIRVESAKRKSATVTFARPAPATADPDSKGPLGAPGTPPKAANKTSSRSSRTSLGETVLTIRVKKSDADAFAQGKLDLDAFRKKASIQSYFRRTDSTRASAFTPVTTR